MLLRYSPFPVGAACPTKLFFPLGHIASVQTHVPRGCLSCLLSSLSHIRDTRTCSPLSHCSSSLSYKPTQKAKQFDAMEPCGGTNPSCLFSEPSILQALHREDACLLLLTDGQIGKAELEKLSRECREASGHFGVLLFSLSLLGLVSLPSSLSFSFDSFRLERVLRLVHHCTKHQFAT